uniref:Uncharacterized protein n=1 Tax=Timema tahoe TaxID=61484 RepID=A0A7R9NY58_9NEOP|nr:unnamed protein product [Timema tahoe]
MDKLQGFRMASVGRNTNLRHEDKLQAGRPNDGKRLEPNEPDINYDNVQMDMSEESDKNHTSSSDDEDKKSLLSSPTSSSSARSTSKSPLRSKSPHKGPSRPRLRSPRKSSSVSSRSSKSSSSIGGSSSSSEDEDRRTDNRDGQTRNTKALKRRTGRDSTDRHLRTRSRSNDRRDQSQNHDIRSSKRHSHSRSPSRIVKQRSQSPLSETLKKLSPSRLIKDGKKHNYTSEKAYSRERTHSPSSKNTWKRSHSPLSKDVKKRSCSPYKKDAKKRSQSPLDKESLRKLSRSPNGRKKSVSPPDKVLRKHSPSPSAKKRSLSPLDRGLKNRSQSRDVKRKSRSPNSKDAKKRVHSPPERDGKKHTSPVDPHRRSSSHHRPKSSHHRHSSRSKDRGRRSRSGDRDRSKRSLKIRGYEKKPSKLSVLERLGIELRPLVTPPAVTPQDLLQKTLEQQVQLVKSSTGIELPSYYNPSAMNPARYAQQVQKKKLLWGNKVDPTPVKEWMPLLRNILRGYHPQDVYNAEQLGMFYNLMPDHTLAVKEDKSKGAKRSKERFTVLLC